MHFYRFESTLDKWKSVWVPLLRGSVENEALENEDRSTKHPKLEKEAPYLENEAPKTRKRRPLNLENEAP